ncbi:viral A-type inclusion protein [Clostridium botulinum]|nr:viral A-type inclusion protein [Clostridium botulinum]NFI18294.1 viral A-type inclusion protein [Clostridium botulinum]NFL93840.1 viral A-type inclusion protein [Clostridium botulinum]NFN50909.1 viral A-type inclusion protein [Clostridium botulinum]NFO28370.1 viral A-type inclusion protein [Clostridium botulinum]
MIQELQTGILDINNKYTVDFICKQLDDIILKIIVYDKSLPADLSDYNVRLKAFKADQVPLIQNTNISIKDNFVTIKASKQLTTTQGIVKAELQFINKTTLEKKSTFYINIEVVASVLDVDGIVSTPTCTILEEIDHKLDQIENIGEVLDEAKEVRDTLTNKTIPTATIINSKLETNIGNASTKITEVESIISSASIKIEEVETSVNNADSSKKELDLSKTNADISKENLDTANVQAEKNIEELKKIGDAKDLAAKVETNKSNIENLQEKVEDNTSQLKENTNNIIKIDNFLKKPIIYQVNGTDMNTLIQNGTHRVMTSVNSPTGGSMDFMVDVYNPFEGNNSIIQMCYCLWEGADIIYERKFINNKWYARKIIPTDDTGWIDISSTINSKATGTAKIRRICNEVFFEITYKGLILENEIVVTMPAEYAPKRQSEYVFCRFPTGIITLDIQPNGKVMMDYKNIGTQKPDFWCSARTSYLID